MREDTCSGLFQQQPVFNFSSCSGSVIFALIFLLVCQGIRTDNPTLPFLTWIQFSLLAFPLLCESRYLQLLINSFSCLFSDFVLVDAKAFSVSSLSCLVKECNISWGKMRLAGNCHLTGGLVGESSELPLLLQPGKAHKPLWALYWSHSHHVFWGEFCHLSHHKRVNQLPLLECLNLFLL